jgi:hypothetical protein
VSTYIIADVLLYIHYFTLLKIVKNISVLKFSFVVVVVVAVIVVVADDDDDNFGDV